MESKMGQRIERSEIVIGKMRFEVVDKYPLVFSETDRKQIEHTLYQVFKKYA
jgi:hypothetical protein